MSWFERSRPTFLVISVTKGRGNGLYTLTFMQQRSVQPTNVRVVEPFRVSTAIILSLELYLIGTTHSGQRFSSYSDTLSLLRLTISLSVCADFITTAKVSSSLNKEDNACELGTELERSAPSLFFRLLFSSAL